jgi:hypothetical protein
MFKTSAVVSALVISTAAVMAAQTKSITGEMTTVTATVQAVEQQTRTLTLKKSDGTFVTLVVPTTYTRFPGIKVGDTVTARYYDNVVFRKLNPGEKPVDTGSGAITKAEGTRPSGTAAVQRTITTKITAIDEKIPSITFSGPNGWVYSSKVQDRNNLKTVKVGDQVNVTWTEALSITVAPPPPSK